MLTHLKLENFKIWRSTGPTRLAPITLLLGTPGSGRSVLMKALAGRLGEEKTLKVGCGQSCATALCMVWWGQRAVGSRAAGGAIGRLRSHPLLCLLLQPAFPPSLLPPAAR